MDKSDYQDAGEGPLKSEALARDKWRGEGGPSKEDAPGHTLPASEAEAETDEGGGSAPNPIAGTMLPPD